jgi:hypothetical protein
MGEIDRPRGGQRAGFQAPGGAPHRRPATAAGALSQSKTIMVPCRVARVANECDVAQVEKSDLCRAFIPQPPGASRPPSAMSGVVLPVPSRCSPAPHKQEHERRRDDKSFDPVPSDRRPSDKVLPLSSTAMSGGGDRLLGAPRNSGVRSQYMAEDRPQELRRSDRRRVATEMTRAAIMQHLIEGWTNPTP